MPLYEYRCEGCGTREECLESLTAPEAHACEACGRPAGMRRQISVAAVALGSPSPDRPPCGTGSGCASGGCPFA
jgi:putative FmdB family regulatory protein